MLFRDKWRAVKEYVDDFSPGRRGFNSIALCVEFTVDELTH
jgi:hypothetical protein